MDSLIYRKLKDILLILTLMCFIGMVVNSCNQSEKINTISFEKQTINEDYLVIQKKLHQEIAKNQIIDNISIQDFIRLNAMDEAINELREEVAKNQKLLLSAQETILAFQTTMKEDSEIKEAFLAKLRSTKVPSNNTSIINKWVKINSLDTDNFQITNDYDVSIGFEKTGFLKYKKPYAVVTNHNPYATPLEIKTYNVNMPKDNRFGLGITAGYGLTNQAKPSYFIGVGVNYNLIRF